MWSKFWLACATSLVSFSSLATAASSTRSNTSSPTTHIYDWNVTWVEVAPDGNDKTRQVIGINGQFPLPVVEVNEGDRVIVNMHNGLGDRNTTIHFHGLFQNGTNAQDGPVAITQCPIPPGYDFVYNFTVDQSGTYWYHSHVDGQYPDGYRQMMIVHPKKELEPSYWSQIDDEIAVTLSDWYHETINFIEPSFLSLYNPSGAEPIPNSFLFNDTLNSKIPVKPNTTYLMRIANIGAFVGQYLYIEDHNFTIVEVDGVYTEPAEASSIYIAVAQRYSIMFTTKDSTDKNFGIVTVADSSLLDLVPSNLQLNQTNWLSYNPDKPYDEVKMIYESSDDIEYFDDFNLVPYDKVELLPEPDYEIKVDVIMNNLYDGINYAFFNNITWTPPKVPTLYTVMSAGEQASDARIYGDYTNTYVYEYGDVVQMVINNVDPGRHPFHLHGRTFQVIDKSPGYDDDSPTAWDPENHNDFPEYPMRRDTMVVEPNGNLVLRWKADNPGVWFFHCHIEWHMLQGLALTIVEAPAEIQKQTIPDNHYGACKAAGLPHEGNAAGNKENFLDLTGQNAQVKSLPAGFTARGIVALVFSCISAFLGMAAITWYGLSDLSLSEVHMIQHAEADAGMDVEEIDPDDVSAR